MDVLSMHNISYYQEISQESKNCLYYVSSMSEQNVTQNSQQFNYISIK